MPFSAIFHLYSELFTLNLRDLPWQITCGEPIVGQDAGPARLTPHGGSETKRTCSMSSSAFAARGSTPVTRRAPGPVLSRPSREEGATENYPLDAEVDGAAGVGGPFHLPSVLPKVSLGVLPLERRDTGGEPRIWMVELLWPEYGRTDGTVSAVVGDGAEERCR